MFKLTLLMLFVCATCHGDIPQSPPATPNVYCGEPPSQLWRCLGDPKLFDIGTHSSCARSASAICDRMSCIFRNSGWLDGAAVNKAKVTEYFEEYARAHPAWAGAVQRVKKVCLTGDVPPQGARLDCPAYDILMCSTTIFIKSAQPSQWTSSPACDAARQYATYCPYCPEECFSPVIPIGSCNACYLSRPSS